MRTNIEIDNDLLEEIGRLTGAPTKRQAVEMALREFVARSKRLELLGLRGKVKWFGDLEESRARRS